MATYTFDRKSDPKLIIVDISFAAITVQELYDVIRDYEDEPSNMDLPRIVSGGGKEELGGGVSVGITVTLYDWYLQFAARPGLDYALCEISGGNLVGFNTTTEQYYVPIYPSAFTTVVRTSSSSATLIEQEALQFASFQNGVWIDIVNGAAGTAYPLGTREFPVNNVADAQTIAMERGFNNLFILGDIAFEDVDDLNGFTVYGQSHDTTITLEGCSTNGAVFRNATVSGDLSGSAIFHDCLLGTFTGFEGHAHKCTLNGKITLAGSEAVSFYDCVDGFAGFGEPIIDFGGSGRGLNVRGWFGGLRLENKSGPEDVSINFTAGRLEIASDVTDGEIVVRGVGQISENSGTATVAATGLVNAQIVADEVWDEVFSEHIVPGSMAEFMRNIIGVVGENIAWSGMSHDSNHNLTAATITQYEDKTLAVIRKQWILAATYDGDNELQTYELKEV